MVEVIDDEELQSYSLNDADESFNDDEEPKARRASIEHAMDPRVKAASVTPKFGEGFNIRKDMHGSSFQKVNREPRHLQLITKLCLSVAYFTGFLFSFVRLSTHEAPSLILDDH